LAEDHTGSPVALSTMAVTSSAAFAHASANPTSTPFVTTPGWFDFLEELESRFAPRGMTKVFCVDAGGEGVEAALKAAFIVHAERRRARARHGAGRPDRRGKCWRRHRNDLL